MNGADSSGLDELPEPVRLFAKHHQSWSTGALLMKWKACGQDKSRFHEEMIILEDNRRRAYYKDLGFTIDPKTGDPL